MNQNTGKAYAIPLPKDPNSHQIKRFSAELGIFLVLIGIAVLFEALGWFIRDQSFLMNTRRLMIMVLQMAEVGLLAIAVTQIIITTGIDLSSGSVLALAAMVATSLAQTSETLRPVFGNLVDLPVLIPVMAGLTVGLICGFINGSLIAITGIPPFIATLGMMVTARGLARYYTAGKPVSMLSESYTSIGSGMMPVIIFFIVAFIFHIALRYTQYGKYMYAIGGNRQAAEVSGINVKKHLIIIYTMAGFLSGLAGIVASSRAATGQSAMGMGYELDAIAAAVIGGTSLVGGVGRISGTVIGVLILGIIMSGFTFIGVDAYLQDIVKGVIIVVAVVIDQIRRKKKR